MLFLFIIISFASLFSSPEKGKIIITIEGVSTGSGTMIIGLFDNQKDFTVTPVMSQFRSVKEKEPMVVVFEDVPYKSYAICIYHDLDENRKLDKNMAGIPKEPYGFSNNPIIVFGPSYEKSTFDLNDKELKLTIQLK